MGVCSMPLSIPDKNGFSARETARLLGVSPYTIVSAIANGQIATIPGKTVLGLPSARNLIPREEVIRLARQMGLLDD